MRDRGTSSAIMLRTYYVLFGTGLGQAATRRRIIGLLYAAMRCPVLIWAILLPGRRRQPELRVHFKVLGWYRSTPLLPTRVQRAARYSELTLRTVLPVKTQL
eukprot:3604577-Rhodomonas_salina.12